MYKVHNVQCTMTQFTQCIEHPGEVAVHTHITTHPGSTAHHIMRDALQHHLTTLNYNPTGEATLGYFQISSDSEISQLQDSHVISAKITLPVHIHYATVYTLDHVTTLT